jgi:hypothetical protein
MEDYTIVGTVETILYDTLNNLAYATTKELLEICLLALKDTPLVSHIDAYIFSIISRRG